jgi:nicotinate-nucleotide pyrophosphorylase (carboxylating)
MAFRPELEFGEGHEQDALRLLQMALDEDLWDGRDWTSKATIPAEAQGSARFVARSRGVVAGLPVAGLAVKSLHLKWGLIATDGDHITPGTELARVEGSMRDLLAIERTALNFLQRLSGIATLTAEFVAAVAGTKAVILDTRKTTPGWRSLEKYAVRCGGGRNHRYGLSDAILIKDNHLAWIAQGGEPDPIGRAIASARELASQVESIEFIEIEVDTLEQLDRALECRPDIILVDNLGADALGEAVRRRDAKAPDVLLEASGGVTLETVAGLARSGVDRISVGALTHSAPALDIGLDFDRGEGP